MSRSLKCLSHRLLLAVMLLALGTAPLVVQSVAWGLMLVEYSRTSTFTAAVEMTFDGEHPCSLCREVQKQQHEGEKKQQTTPAPRDLVLYHVAGSASSRPAETFSQPQKRSHEAALLLTPDAKTARATAAPSRLGICSEHGPELTGAISVLCRVAGEPPRAGMLACIKTFFLIAS